MELDSSHRNWVGFLGMACVMLPCSGPAHWEFPMSRGTESKHCVATPAHRRIKMDVPIFFVGSIFFATLHFTNTQVQVPLSTFGFGSIFLQRLLSLRDSRRGENSSNPLFSWVSRYMARTFFSVRSFRIEWDNRRRISRNSNFRVKIAKLVFASFEFQ